MVKLTDRRESALTPLERVKAKIRHKILLEKQKATEQAFKQEIKTEVPIEIYHNILDKIELPDKSDSKRKPPKLP